MKDAGISTTKGGGRGRKQRPRYFCHRLLKGRKSLIGSLPRFGTAGNTWKHWPPALNWPEDSSEDVYNDKLSTWGGGKERLLATKHGHVPGVFCWGSLLPPLASHYILPGSASGRMVRTRLETWPPFSGFMVDYNLISSLGNIDDDVDAAVATALGDAANNLEKLVSGEEVQDFTPGAILKGRVSSVAGDDFVIELGLKSEGILERGEFDEPNNVKIGDEVKVLLEDVEGDTGLVKISKRKADRIINWETIMRSKKEGDPVSGKVTKKIKGGLLVDIGVPVFLPASQVDIRRPGEISDWIGRTIDAVILKIDEERRNIVISRRKMIEQQREELKRKTLDGLSIGEVRKGIVKNIADFGAFIDLGGIDGLLHITDMSWGRINHPSEVLKIDQEIEVKVLSIDKEKEKIALGLKQKEASPWENIESRFTVGSSHEAEVVNIMSYGAFCKLEEGVEGLVHISEMSWTKRINHPSEVVSQDQKVKVKVLEINKEKQEISLGMKQVEENPWERVAEKYPPGSVVEGKVRNIANYGAFVEIEEGIDGLLHVSDLSWTKKIGHPSEMLKKGENVQAVVLSVDQEKQRIALGLKKM